MKPKICQHLSHQLCHRLYVVSHAITRQYRAGLDKVGLTYPQYVVMMSLWEEDEITISDLQHHTLIDTGALSVMLKKMCDKNFIEIIPSTDDKRKKVVKLSEKGRELENITLKERQCMPHGYQQSLSDEEFQQLIVLLDTLKGKLI